MKLQAASRKEIKRIAIGVLICDVLMVAALFLLSLVGVGTFSLLRVLLGTLGGSIIAIANFTLLCLTVQAAAEIGSKKQMRRQFQRSYYIRMILQAGWVVLCFVIPQIHFVAGAAPTLFPNVIIYYLQYKGRLMPAEPRTDAPKIEDGPEDHLESFEV